MEIVSIQDLLEKLETKAPTAKMFRGQSKDWPLLPSIGRYQNIVLWYSDWRFFHDHVIDKFMREARPHFAHYPQTDVEKWVEAQHHGVPTRLLDTSTNPLKALFFAVCNSKEDSDGVFWAFDYDMWRSDMDEPYRKYWENDIFPFLPAQYTPRLTAQEGAFISYPLPENKSSMPTLDKLDHEHLRCIKFTIPYSSKAKIRRELHVLGCQYRLLFPDIDGVARGIISSEFQGD